MERPTPFVAPIRRVINASRCRRPSSDPKIRPPADMLAAAAPLRDPLGLPTSWSIPFGVAMLGGALVLLLIAGYPVISRRHAAAVVAVNAVSVLGTLALAWSGLLPLTAAGIVFLLVGAVVVAVFATAEYVGLRRMPG